MSRKVAVVLAVAVLAGRVSVDYDGKQLTLSAGETWASADEGERALPEGVRGFSWQVRGVVTAKGDKHVFFFKVARVLRVWEGNKARTPGALAGRTVRVGPRWVKNRHGKWRPVELHVLFIRKLQVGHEMTLEIRNVEGDHFQILELSGPQREWAARGGEGEGEREGDRPRNGDGDREGPHEGEGGDDGVREEEVEVDFEADAQIDALPEGVRGFSGQVRGVVNRKGDKHVFIFTVARVLKVWKNNKAENPEALANLTVRVGPRWVKGEGGKWRPVELHVLFIRKLQPGQEVTLELHNVERDHFAILELSGPQREWAARGGEGDAEREGEGERPREVEREGERSSFVLNERAKEEGRVLAVVKGVEKSKLVVKVLKTNGRGRIKPGQTVTFFCQWELKEKSLNPKKGHNWRPARHEMHAIRAFKKGERVEIGYYHDEHPRIRSIEAAGDGPAEKAPDDALEF